TDNIKNISISPENNIFALLINDNPKNSFSVGYVFNKNQIDNPEIVLESELTQFLTEWINERYISLNTKPSYLSEGFSYVLDTQTRNLTKILGPVPGLN